MNYIKVLMNYFSTPDRPVSSTEFKAFWVSCFDVDKDNFKSFATTLPSADS
jgi:hypothetical protein